MKQYLGNMMKQALFVFLFFVCGMAGFAQGNAPLYNTGKDSVTIAASNKYSHPSFFTRIFLGNNYRKVWATPVTFPVFHLQEAGFNIKEMGGGQQTTSIKLEDKNKNEYALRSVDKDVKPVALPPALRKPLFIRVTQNMVSAAFPYAPLVIPGLAEAAGVVTPHPVFYFVPDDDVFGKYKKLFANKLFMLEDREKAGEKTEPTKEFVARMLKNADFKMDGNAILRARLLDMLIADWDRHQDQWRWAMKDSAGSKYAYAIPRDRDQAFFLSNGLLVKIARVFGLRHMVGFKASTRKVRNLNAKTWNFDRTFINELDKNDWRQVIQAFQSNVTNDVITNSVQKLPPEIFKDYGTIIKEKLMARRDGLGKDGLRYYDFLSRYVTITGTDDAEYFHVTGNKNSITITRYKADNRAEKLYQRTFYPKETMQVKIMGLGGNDIFEVDKEAAAHIKLYIDGGKGNNQYHINSRIKHKIYNSDADAASYMGVEKEFLKIRE